MVSFRRVASCLVVLYGALAFTSISRADDPVCICPQFPYYEEYDPENPEECQFATYYCYVHSPTCNDIIGATSLNLPCGLEAAVCDDINSCPACQPGWGGLLATLGVGPFPTPIDDREARNKTGVLREDVAPIAAGDKKTRQQPVPPRLRRKWPHDRQIDGIIAPHRLFGEPLYVSFRLRPEVAGAQERGEIKAVIYQVIVFPPGRPPQVFGHGREVDRTPPAKTVQLGAVAVPDPAYTHASPGNATALLLNLGDARYSVTTTDPESDEKK